MSALGTQHLDPETYSLTLDCVSNVFTRLGRATHTLSSNELFFLAGDKNVGHCFSLILRPLHKGMVERRLQLFVQLLNVARLHATGRTPKSRISNQCSPDQG